MGWNAAGSLKGAKGDTGAAGTTTLRGASDYDNSAAPSSGQAILWVPDGSGGGRFAPRTITPASIGAAADSDVVHLAGAETINGVKTFGSAPQVPVGNLLANPVRRDDTRLTDARAPTAHKGTHATGGADAITPADIGAQTVAAESMPGALVPNGYLGADSTGRCPNGLLYAATESAYGIMRGRDAARYAGIVGSAGDRGVYGDGLSPWPRLSTVVNRTGANGTLYQTATVAAYDDTATKVRVASRAASAGSGSLLVGVFVGSDPTNLARVATASATAVANGVLELTLSASVSYQAGQWVAVTVLTTGFSTAPNWATGNAASALMNGNGYQMGGTRTGQSATPTSLNLSSGASGDGQVPWWALV